VRGGIQLTYDAFNGFCRTLPVTSYVMQWRGCHVWKVGGKVFAIGGWADGEAAFTFKVNGIAYEMMKDQPGLEEPKNRRNWGWRNLTSAIRPAPDQWYETEASRVRN